MAAREAHIRVTFDVGSTLAGLERVRQKAKKTGKDSGRALSEPLKKGAQGAKSAFGDLFSSIKSGLQTALTLGGAVGFGAAIAEAQSAETAYLQLSNALSTYGEESVSAAEAQRIVNAVADETKADVAGIRTTLMQLASAAKQADIQPLLEAATNQARRLGVEGEFIARVYTRLIAKGVTQTADETEILVEQMNKLFRTMLGVDIDEAMDPMDVAEFAGFLNTTGNSAEQMFKLISMGGKEIAKDFGKANELVEELGLSLKQSKGIDEMRKKLHLGKGVIDSQKSAIENMLAIADKGPKTFAKMADAMAGDIAGQALKEIVGEELLVNARAGKITRKEWNLRIEGLRSELNNVEGVMVDRKRLEEEDRKHKESLAADIDAAMNDVKAAFASPEMVAALKDLAKYLPPVAQGAADFLKWVVENPLMAAGGYAGLKIGKDFTGEFAKSLFSKLGKNLEKRITRSGNKFGDKVDISGHSFLEAAAKSGNKFTRAAQAAGGVLSAALAGVAIGTAIHEAVTGPQSERAAKRAEKVEQRVFQAKEMTQRGTIEEKMAALKGLQRAKKEMPDTLLSAENVMGQLTAWVAGTESPMQAFERRQRDIAEAEAALTKSMQEEIAERQNQVRTAKEFQQAVQGATQALRMIQPSAARGVAPTARGPQQLPTMTGAAPVRG